MLYTQCKVVFCFGCDNFLTSPSSKQLERFPPDVRAALIASLHQALHKGASSAPALSSSAETERVTAAVQSAFRMLR
jgi:hypothetical protein